MQLLKLGFQMFARRLGLSVLLAVQLAIGILLLNFTFLQVQMLRGDYEPVSPLSQEKGLYAMGDASIRTGFAQTLNSLPGVKTVSTIQTRLLKSSPDTQENIKLLSYDEAIAKRLPMPLKKGSWLGGQTPGSADGIPVVIGKETGVFRLGASLTVYGRVVKGEQETVVPVQIKIVGVLDSAQRYLSYDRGGNGISLLDLVKRNDSNYSGELLLLSLEKDAREKTEVEAFDSATGLVLFQADTPDAVMRENAQRLSRDAQVLTLEQLTQAAQKEISGRWAQLLPFIVCALTISLVSIVSSGALHARMELRHFAIYYVCGARWKNCLMACVGYIGILLLCTLFLVSAGLSVILLSGVLENVGIALSPFHLGVTAAVLLVAACAYVLPSYITLRRIEPITLIHENE